jgi:hypothetical protein
MVDFSVPDMVVEVVEVVEESEIKVKTEKPPVVEVVVVQDFLLEMEVVSHSHQVLVKKIIINQQLLEVRVMQPSLVQVEVVRLMMEKHMVVLVEMVDKMVRLPIMDKMVDNKESIEV